MGKWIRGIGLCQWGSQIPTILSSIKDDLFKHASTAILLISPLLLIELRIHSFLPYSSLLLGDTRFVRQQDQRNVSIRSIPAV